MCVKLPPGDLNSSPYPSHPTSTYTYPISTYTCGVTIAQKNVQWLLLVLFFLVLVILLLNLLLLLLLF